MERPVSVGQRVDSDRQLVRLLQIGIVLEEVVEARATRHYQSIDDSLDTTESHHDGNSIQHTEYHSDDDADTDTTAYTDDTLEALLSDAVKESARHRDQLEELINVLDAESIAFDKIQTLVEGQYGRTELEDFDDVIYDQLCNEETAYKFYDDLVTAIQASDVSFGIDRKRLLDVLKRLKAEEAEGVEAVINLMEQRK